MIYSACKDLKELKERIKPMWDEYHEKDGDVFYFKSNVDGLSVESSLDEIIDTLDSSLDESVVRFLMVPRDLRDVSEKPKDVLTENSRRQKSIWQKNTRKVYGGMLQKGTEKYECFMLWMDFVSVKVKKRKKYIYYPRKMPSEESDGKKFVKIHMKKSTNGGIFSKI